MTDKIKSKITLVTGYFDMPSKYSHETYKNWMKNFLSLDEAMVIFTDDKTFDYIKSFRKPENTIIIKTSIKNFEVYKYIDYWNYCKSIDIEKGHHSIEMYMIWNEKSYFCEKAINWNVFNSEYFFWIDIGCVKDKNTLKYMNKFNVDNIPKDKTILSQVYNTKPNPILNINNISVSFQNIGTRCCNVINYIQGGFFGGHINVMKTWITIFKNELNLFINTKTFGGKDQNIMGNLTLKYPQHIYKLQPKEYNFDDIKLSTWWSFLIRMSELNKHIN